VEGGSPVTILETDRLTLRRLTVDDSAFILRLLNEPSFIRHIGDRGVRSLADAKQYILAGPMASYDRHGYGGALVELKDTHLPIGICGLIRRDTIDDVELRFAFVPESWSKGYAFEAASAMITYAHDKHGLKRLVAITSQENFASINLLVKLGFYFDRMVRLPDEKEELRLFARNFKEALA
jgi:RimJ/RimL family protein N-acetyltransferase